MKEQNHNQLIFEDWKLWNIFHIIINYHCAANFQNDCAKDAPKPAHYAHIQERFNHSLLFFLWEV